ncbi:PAS domain S-box protein [Anabaena sp. UHCC 0187]|uniref:PAS domain S-box protein n=1 Tax=Anabaena sp. UHCC 0187 TaxID=2590018 RepID=UPI001446A451|nr:PAS domain S-box protein [Anabaena sp. UHCC 0187]MTJ11142.1 PAS domain S-box protein [Anabaena sp. UHCC 0187]
MEDDFKTRQQLITELQTLRAEVSALKRQAAWQKRRSIEGQKQYTILLVDDSTADCGTYQRYLTQNQLRNYQIIEFDNGEDALLWCQQQMPDVMLIDYFLPDMDGLEFLQELRQQTGKDRIPVIMITGQDNTEVVVDLFKSGAQDYLEKSCITAENLHQAINNVLHQTQLIQEQEWQQQRQQLIGRTALSIRDCVNVEDILNTTVTEIRSILKSDRIIIYQFQPDGTGLVVKESVGDQKFSILDRIVIDQCFGESWVELYQQGRTKTIDDIYTELDINECYQQFLQNFDIRANLIVPIIQEDHLWGLLIAHECTAPRQWTSTEVEFINQLAIQVGIAIQQASLIEQLQTELAQRQRLTSILEATPDFVGMATPQGQVIWLNPAAKKMMGIADIQDFTVVKSHPEWALDIIQNQGIPTAIETGSWLGETAILRQDGSEIPVSQLIVAHKSVDQEILYTSTIMRDISERKLAEIALQEREKQLELFAKYAPAGIAMLDRNMHYVIASQRWINDYQLESIASIIGKSHYQIFPEITDRWRQIHQRCLAGAIEKCEEDLFVRKDGVNQWLRWEVRPWYNNNNEICGIIIFSEDITQGKQIEIELQQLNIQLEARVTERTAQLSQANDKLQIELLQREKLERELRNREQLLDGFFYAASQVNVGLCIFDTTLNFLKINQALADTNGYSIEAHIGKSVIELLPDIAPTVVPLFQTILDTKQAISNLEISGIVPSQPKVIRYWLVSYFPILGETGNSVAIGGIVIEITERKRLEMEREKLIAIIEATSDIIGTVRFDTQKAEYINKAGRRLFGLADNAPVDHISIADMYPQWALEIVQKHGIPAAVRHGVWVGETAFLNHEGREIPISQVVIAQTFGKNYTQYISTICRDITEQKQNEATLQESNRRWKSLLDNVQLIVIGLDINGNVDYANPFFLQLTNYIESEVLGKNWFNNFLPDSQQDSVEICFQEVIEKNFHPHYQNTIFTKSGEERIISWSNTLLRNAEGNPIGTISIGEDITERYKLERMKAEFISIVSHELRTPLTSMQAGLSLLYDKIIDPNSPEGEATIEIATEGVDRLVRLVNDILDLERLESGKISLEKSVYNTAELINTAIDQMQDMAIQAGIILHATSPSYQVYADSDRLLQLLINLLSNAIKFSPCGANVWLTVESVVSGQWSVVRREEREDYSPHAPYLLFAVKDQGRGIPHDSLESIFDRFQQVDASDSRSKGGTGLGLAICRNIVEQHEGSIWAESVLGEGSTFYFTLPIKEVSNGN